MPFVLRVVLPDEGDQRRFHDREALDVRVHMVHHAEECFHLALLFGFRHVQDAVDFLSLEVKSFAVDLVSYVRYFPEAEAALLGVQRDSGFDEAFEDRAEIHAKIVYVFAEDYEVVQVDFHRLHEQIAQDVHRHYSLKIRGRAFQPHGDSRPLEDAKRGDESCPFLR